MHSKVGSNNVGSNSHGQNTQLTQTRRHTDWL